MDISTVFFSYNVTTLYKLKTLKIKHFSVPLSFIHLNSSEKCNQTCATASLENMGFGFSTKFLDVSQPSKLHSIEGSRSGQSKLLLKYQI